MALLVACGGGEPSGDPGATADGEDAPASPAGERATPAEGSAPPVPHPGVETAPPSLPPLPADSALLLADLAFLSSDALEGRAPGSPGSAAARERIVAAFAEAGVRPLAGGLEVPFQLTARDGSERMGTNVVGSLPGTVEGAPTIVVTAHYDHVGVRGGEIYNGADDNASGTGALLFLARRLSAEPLRHPVILAAVDAEEGGLRGARAFVDDPPVPLERIALAVNMDMVARTAGVLWAAGAHHTPELRPVLEEVAARAPLTLSLGHDRPGAPEGDDWTRSSDHAPFHAAGIPFVYFGVEDHPDYHRPTDDFAAVDPGEYVASVRTILMALRALDSFLPDTASP